MSQFILSMYSVVFPDDYDLYLETPTLDLLDKKLIICGDFNCPEFRSVSKDNMFGEDLYKPHYLI